MRLHVVALVDEVGARGRTPDQTLLLTVFLCQLALNRLNFLLKCLHLALSFIELLLFRLDHLPLRLQLLLLPLHLFFLALRVLKVAFKGTLS